MDGRRIEQEVSKFEEELKIAQQNNDPKRVVKVYNEAKKRFKEVGFPDNWWDVWEKAHGEAKGQLRVESPLW